MRTGWLLVVAVIASAWAAACGGAPQPAEPDEPQPAVAKAKKFDDCAAEPGKPPPEPLKKKYDGVAAKARCQREVFSIMGGLTFFLGVKCAHCHDEPDYPKMTHKKLIANWMARELIPSIQKKKGGEVWCNDCHVVDGKGTAKILKSPRDERWAAEWMATHLVEDFDDSTGHPLRCKTCHGGNPGTPEFKKKIILTDNLPPRPRPAQPEPEAPPSEPTAPADDAGVSDAGTASDAR
jgi:hypothetical protein